ncbi:MAG: BNR-4 repeat-containing protein [Tunicatimonas sp.]
MYAYGDKYSGGLGTYTAKHKPLAIYSPAVEKTFFVYGGTTDAKERRLLCMIGSFDHRDSTVSRPTVVYDKQGVDDPHDNPSLLIDAEGYLWVFVSGRNTRRPGFKLRSNEPYNTEAFTPITQEEMTYPQPWFIPKRGFFHFFTKYTGVRELYFETSPDGRTWTEDQKLAGIKGTGETKSGHYQVSGHHGDTLATFFSRHPNGDVDQRTNLYYLQTTDFGETWTTADGTPVATPVTEVASPARVIDYESDEINVYLKDMNFDQKGHPVALYLTSGGHEPGPDNDPREWCVTFFNGTAWKTTVITTSDHNYDMGSLRIDGTYWTVMAPTTEGPQRYGGGGEVTQWESQDHGETWTKVRQVTIGSERNHNYVRRVVNGRSPFLYYWADGNPDTLSPSNLYVGDSVGHYWTLPYRMEREREKLRAVDN